MIEKGLTEWQYLKKKVEVTQEQCLPVFTNRTARVSPSSKTSHSQGGILEEEQRDLINNKTDVYVEYKTGDGSWHRYSLDILIRRNDGKCLIIEKKVKIENNIPLMVKLVKKQ